MWQHFHQREVAFSTNPFVSITNSESFGCCIKLDNVKGRTLCSESLAICDMEYLQAKWDNSTQPAHHQVSVAPSHCRTTPRGQLPTGTIHCRGPEAEPGRQVSWWAEHRMVAAARGFPFSHNRHPCWAPGQRGQGLQQQWVGQADAGSRGHPIFTTPATTMPNSGPQRLGLVAVWDVRKWDAPCRHRLPAAHPIHCFHLWPFWPAVWRQVGVVKMGNPPATPLHSANPLASNPSSCPQHVGHVELSRDDLVVVSWPGQVFLDPPSRWLFKTCSSAIFPGMNVFYAQETDSYLNEVTDIIFESVLLNCKLTLYFCGTQWRILDQTCSLLRIGDQDHKNASWSTLQYSSCTFLNLVKFCKTMLGKHTLYKKE